MKRKALYILVLLIMVYSNGFGQFISSYISFPSSVNLFGLYEISFTLPTTYSNPYDPDVIMAYAEFTGPDNSTYTVQAFYYEDYTFHQHPDGYEVATHNTTKYEWRIRFTPNQVGTWTFIVRASDSNGALQLSYLNLPYTFTCNSVSQADGFITKANSKYLKRDVVRNSQRQFQSFFPIGPNVAWYDSKTYCEVHKPLGIYSYEEHIDSLYNNANYMRIWINRYQYLSLYGPDYFDNNNNIDSIVYFDSTINQKDAAELDYIITYAKQHDIAIMLSIFNQGDFMGSEDHCNHSIWANNPYNTVLDLGSPCDFFTNNKAKRVTKNLIRYIVSRWGYATNLMCWELWNEVDFLRKTCEDYQNIDNDIKNWHDTMSMFIKNEDPFHHCISTSTAGADNNLYPIVFSNMDINQQHNYQKIQIAQSFFQLSYALFVRTRQGHNEYGEEPFFMGEFGFSNMLSDIEKDPYGVSLHNSLWSSLFSSSLGPASFWWWDYLDSKGLYKRFTPLLRFCQTLPILSRTFTGKTTGSENNEVVVFPNNIQTYYMINGTEDTIMGWSQDTAFAYQSLRWLTDSVTRRNDTVNGNIIVSRFYFVDSVILDPNGYIYTLNPMKRPRPSSNSNTITLPISNQPVGTHYRVKWYNSETGYAYVPTTYVNVYLNGAGEKVVSFPFPSYIRDIQNQTINNTFGDAAFILVKSNIPVKETPDDKKTQKNQEKQRKQ